MEAISHLSAEIIVTAIKYISKTPASGVYFLERTSLIFKPIKAMEGKTNKKYNKENLKICSSLPTKNRRIQ